MPQISGIAYWASIQKPNTKFEPQWTIDLLINKEQAEELHKAAKELVEGKNDKIFEIKKDEEKGGFIVRFRQKVERADGSLNEAPRVIDITGKPFTALVGNGSEVTVLYRLYRTEYKGKGFINGGLRAVKILKHVPYAGTAEEEDFFGGSSTKGSSTTNNKNDLPFDDDIDFS